MVLSGRAASPKVRSRRPPQILHGLELWEACCPWKRWLNKSSKTVAPTVLIGGVHRFCARRNSPVGAGLLAKRSEEHTSELQSLMRISYAVFCLKKKIYHTLSLP